MRRSRNGLIESMGRALLGTMLAFGAVGCSDSTAPRTVTFRTNGIVPELLALKDGPADWVAVQIGMAEEQTVTIDGAYLAYAYACAVEPDDWFNWELAILHLATGEVDGPITPCPAPRVHVTGQSILATAVYVDRAIVPLAPGTREYRATVSAGTHDLVAQGETSTGKFLIQRGEVLDADRRIDLDISAGPVLVPRPFDVADGVSPWTVSTRLVTEGGTHARLRHQPTLPPVLALPPLAARAPGDKVLAIAVNQLAPERWQTVQHLVTGMDIPPFEFGAPLSIEVAQPRYTWTGGPYATEAIVYWRQPGSPEGRHTMLIRTTEAWQTAGELGSGEWMHPAALPGWTVPPPDTTGFEAIWSISVRSGDVDGEMISATAGLLDGRPF